MWLCRRGKGRWKDGFLRNQLKFYRSKCIKLKGWTFQPRKPYAHVAIVFSSLMCNDAFENVILRFRHRPSKHTLRLLSNIYLNWRFVSWTIGILCLETRFLLYCSCFHLHVHEKKLSSPYSKENLVLNEDCSYFENNGADIRCSKRNPSQQKGAFNKQGCWWQVFKICLYRGQGNWMMNVQGKIITHIYGKQLKIAMFEFYLPFSDSRVGTCSRSGNSLPTLLWLKSNNFITWISTMITLLTIFLFSAKNPCPHCS